MFPLFRSKLRLFTLLAASADAFAQTPVIPKGTQISVRTLDDIHSKQSEVGQSYRCTVDSPVTTAAGVTIPKGADCVLRIVEMKNAGRLTGSNELKLTLSELRIGESLQSVDSEPKAVEGKGKGTSTATRAGIGGAAGAGLGALVGRGKGAAIGAGVGAGAGVASAALTKGPEIKVAPETILTFVIQ